MKIIINRIKGLEVLLKTIHLGKNPVNGGRPPKESKFRNKIARNLVGVI